MLLLVLNTKILNDSHTIKVARIYHERRMGGIDDLVKWLELFFEVPEQVGLSIGVKGQPGFVEEQDYVCILGWGL